MGGKLRWERTSRTPSSQTTELGLIQSNTFNNFDVPWSDDAKYIYVARNPKDCCVSFYHHMKDIPGYQFADGTFEEFFDLFTKGELEFGDFFDHLIPWNNIRTSKNVFLTTFEEMKRDFKSLAIKVAEFIDENEAKYLNDNPVILERILYNCTFEEMKKFINDGLSYLYNVKNKELLAELPKGRKHIIAYNEALPKKKSGKLNFIRKGKTGSWQEMFTPAQNEIFNTYITEKTKDSDVMMLWKNLDRKINGSVFKEFY
ncbi:sulfotransferase 1C2A [Trichonephila clavipes]|nr:sulfotransferase 1C2A [Trichonephila clavipes]